MPRRVVDRRDPAPKARCGLHRITPDGGHHHCWEYVVLETGQYTVVERCVAGHVLRMHPVVQEKMEWYEGSEGL